MANQSRTENRSADARNNEYMKGGRGRKDEVGGSGIYPASSPDAPADAEIRSEGELVAHKGPRPKSTDDEGVRKNESQ
jgi:hypothetical protein